MQHGVGGHVPLGQGPSELDDQISDARLEAGPRLRVHGAGEHLAARRVQALGDGGDRRPARSDQAECFRGLLDLGWARRALLPGVLGELGEHQGGDVEGGGVLRRGALAHLEQASEAESQPVSYRGERAEIRLTDGVER